MVGLKKAALAACALAAIAAGTASATLADASVAPTAETQPTGQRLTIGSPRSGGLARGDEQLNSGEFVDRYRFQGRRGQRVSVALESGDFDTYVILVPPGGSQQDNDDAGEGSTNSRIETALAEDGEYEIMVTSFRPGEAGRYTLNVQPSQGSARQAAAPTGARVFALFVGVSDYGGRIDDLPDTDGDAKGLALRMEQAGVLNAASIVLTNEEATRDGVRSAFARLASQAGPQDTFLFFFSGHGDRVAASAGSLELDGQTETLELRDGALTDRELAQMFSTLRTRLSVVALDSCYSGGFNDVIARPNVMGIFSSEEDLTSQVASTYEAGGYLSHFLTSGMSGAADMDGDSMLTAGELAAYLRQSFREEGDIPASTNDGLQSYQNLIIARGGVNVDEVIYRFNARS